MRPDLCWIARIAHSSRGSEECDLARIEARLVAPECRFTRYEDPLNCGRPRGIDLESSRSIGPSISAKVSGRFRDSLKGKCRRLCKWQLRRSQDASAGITPPYTDAGVHWPTSRMRIGVQKDQ